MLGKNGQNTVEFLEKSRLASLGSMMLSSAGCWQSTVNFMVSAPVAPVAVSPKSLERNKMLRIAEAMTDFLAGTVAFFFLSRASSSGSALSPLALAVEWV